MWKAVPASQAPSVVFGASPGLCGCSNSGIYYQVRGEEEALRGRGEEGQPDDEENRTFSSWPFSHHQQGDSFVTEDCSQLCTCASSEVLLCEPFSCSAGEICTLGWALALSCFHTLEVPG